MRRVLPTIVLVAGLLVIVALAGFAILTVPSRIPVPEPVPVAEGPPPSVAFVGDSLTSGTVAGGMGAANYTAILQNRNGWRVTNSAVDGAGYVAGSTFLAQLPKVVAARPQTVVVIGGRADYDDDPAAVRDSATRLYQEIARQLPQAKVVVIGPAWPGTDAPLRIREERDAVRDAAAAARLPFVDPIADQWFNGPDIVGVAPDGEHLNDVGHRRLADLVGDAVVRSRK